VIRFKGMRFEPMGHTSNPDIPEASSIVDYVARYLELHFGQPAQAPRLRLTNRSPVERGDSGDSGQSGTIGQHGPSPADDNPGHPRIA
jgi:ribonucleoside-diphosphate reductase alpha chain